MVWMPWLRLFLHHINLFSCKFDYNLHTWCICHIFCSICIYDQVCMNVHSYFVFIKESIVQKGYGSSLLTGPFLGLFTLWGEPLITWTSLYCLPQLQKRKKIECIANTYTMSLDFYPKRIPTTTNAFTLQHIPTNRSCDYLSLSVLLNTSSDANIVFIIMFPNVN